MIGIDVDPSELRRVARELAASEDDVRRAWRRAKTRTARRLRTQARVALRQGLELRSAAVLRARLKLRSTRDDASLWVGLNDLPATAFRGRPRETGSGASVGGREFPGAFVGRGKDSGRALVFKRAGASRLPVHAETASIEEEGGRILEAAVMVETANTLMRNFVAEVRARTIYGIGR